MDFWIMEYTKRRNLNRANMKLDVWQRGMDLFEMTYRLAADVADFKLRSQFIDWTMGCTTPGSPSPRASPSGSPLPADGRGARGEGNGRVGRGRTVRRLSITSVGEFDQLHYEVENKLLARIRSIEAKRGTGDWQDSMPSHP